MQGKTLNVEKIYRISKKILSNNGQRETAREEGVSPATVSAYAERLEKAGIKELGQLTPITPEALVQIIYPKATVVQISGGNKPAEVLHKRSGRFDADVYVPDAEALANEMLDRKVTKAFMFMQYEETCKEAGRQAMSRSSFYDMLGRELKKMEDPDVYMIQSHPYGQTLEIDYIGETFPAMTPDGSVRDLVCCTFAWTASCYVYATFIPAQTTVCTCDAVTRAIRFFGVVPAFLRVDNAKSMIQKHQTGRDAIVNESFKHHLQLLGIDVDATNPYSPTSKSVVEYSNRLIKERIYPRLPRGTPLSDEELDAIMNRLIDEYINSVGFRARGKGTPRKKLFEEREAPACRLAPEVLPAFAEYFEFLHVERSYTVKVDGYTLSVPYRLASGGIYLSATRSGDIVTIYKGTEKVAEHNLKLADEDKVLVNPDHMPEAHREHAKKQRKYKDDDSILQAAAHYGGPIYNLVGSMLRWEGGGKNKRSACICILNTCKRRPYEITEIQEACKRLQIMPPAQSWNSYVFDAVLQEVIDYRDSHNGRIITQTSIEDGLSKEEPEPGELSYLRGADAFA